LGAQFSSPPLDVGGHRRLERRELKHTERDDWDKCLRKLRGFPMSRFPNYPTLKLLHLVGNAVRHGNGDSTRALYASNPEMLLEHEVTTGWFSYFAHGGEPTDSTRNLEISVEQLEAFKAAIVDFWLAVRALQLSASSDASPHQISRIMRA